MTRNEQSEQTIKQILAVSERLFVERGYEKTTIQNIIDELGLSKGAIYHHFESKKEILKAIVEGKSGREQSLMIALANETKAETAFEKLRGVFAAFIAGTTEIYDNSMADMISLYWDNPQYIVAAMKSNITDGAPLIAQMFEEGIADGSLKMDYPLEYAEILLLLLSIWSKPGFFDRDAAKTRRCLEALQQVMRLGGADIISDEFIERTLSLYGEIGYY